MESVNKKGLENFLFFFIFILILLLFATAIFVVPIFLMKKNYSGIRDKGLLGNLKDNKMILLFVIATVVLLAVLWLISFDKSKVLNGNRKIRKRNKKRRIELLT